MHSPSLQYQDCQQKYTERYGTETDAVQHMGERVAHRIPQHRLGHSHGLLGHDQLFRSLGSACEASLHPQANLEALQRRTLPRPILPRDEIQVGPAARKEVCKSHLASQQLVCLSM